MMLNDCTMFWPFTKALVTLVSIAIHRAYYDPPSLAVSIQAPSMAIQEVEKELANVKRLSRLYVFATDKSSEDADAGLFAQKFNGQIDPGRLRKSGGRVHVAGDNQSSSEIQLTKAGFKTLLELFAKTDAEQLLNIGRHPLEYVLTLLTAAIGILTNPFSATREMELFRNNAAIALKKSYTDHFWNFEKPEEIAGVTKTSLRTILDIYSGMGYKMAYFAEQPYSAAEHDGPLIVYNAHMFDDSNSYTVLLHLVRLCQITDLNMRNCILQEQLSPEAQDILAVCQITRLVPPYLGESPAHLFLLPHSNIEIQNRIWHSLAEVSWLSKRGDWLQIIEFDLIFETPATIFLQNLTRPAIRPDDFIAIELLSIYNIFNSLADMMKYLERAVNLRMLNLVYVHTSLTLDFLKNMTKLEALWLGETNLVVLSEDVLSSLSNLSILAFLSTQLATIPPEIGRLKKLKKLIANNNLLLTTIPDTLSDCPELLAMDLSGNRLQSLPSRLDNLAYLDISRNHCPELLAAVTNYTALESLDAADNNIFNTFPADFGKLKNLRILNLNSNSISEVPPAIAELPVLGKLFLSSNRLSSLPHFVANLRYLQMLYLASNRFQRIPGFVKGMKKENNLPLLDLSYNPLQSSDTLDELGLITLWDTFGTCVMPESEYTRIGLQNQVNGIYEYNRKVFYRKLTRLPLHWNMEMLKQLRLTAPPPHCKLPKADLENTWTEVLGNPVLADGIELFDGLRLNELVEVLYNPALVELRGHAIGEENKSVMKNYLAAVTLNIQERMEQGDTGRAIAVLIQLNDSLGNCPSGQAGALMEIYRLHCLGHGPDDLEAFVEEFIAREKEDRFTGALALPEHPQNVHLMLYWKMCLKDDLGLSLEYEDPYDRQGPDQFGGDQIAVLKAFFGRFSPGNVIRALTEKINIDGRVGDVGCHLDGLNLLPVDVRGEYFELVEGVEGAAENFYFKAVREAGVTELLVSMGILLRRQ